MCVTRQPDTGNNMAVGQTLVKASKLYFFSLFLSNTAVFALKSGSIGNCPISSTNFSAAFLHNPPYVKANSTKWHGLIYDFVQAGLIRCFRRYSCNMTKMHWKEVFSEEKLSSLTLEEKTDIAIPITPSLFSSLTEELSTSRNWRVTLVTIVESPGLALVIDYDACKTKIEKIITYTILSAWPVCAVILLLAGISGISIWALETSTNYHHFPSSFGRGSTEGFWWAFVTMTTVGYGDKVPRTMYGRLFSVVWILTGVCLISIFTAAITSAITVSSVDPGCKSTQGKRLAAINGSDAEKEARHRGAYVTTFETEMKMFDMLTAGDVDGVMLDRFKAYYYLDQLKNDNLRVALRIDTSLQYGVSLIDRGFPELTGKNGCLAEYFVNSRHRLDRTMKHYIMPVKPLGSPTETVGVLSIHSRANQHLLITSVCIFVSFLISGLLWEFLYRRNHFSFFKSSPRGNKTNGSPLINKELAEIQNALEKLTAQVHTVQENL